MNVFSGNIIKLKVEKAIQFFLRPGGISILTCVPLRQTNFAWKFLMEDLHDNKMCNKRTQLVSDSLYLLGVLRTSDVDFWIF